MTGKAPDPETYAAKGFQTASGLGFAKSPFFTSSRPSNTAEYLLA
jgi:hypothetical protein